MYSAQWFFIPLLLFAHCTVLCEIKFFYNYNFSKSQRYDPDVHCVTETSEGT